MIQELIKDCRDYFNRIEHPTEEEKDLAQRLNAGYFPITSVHRDDLKAKGFDVDKISDDDMEELAQKMGNDYCTQLFWESMELIAEFLNFPKTYADVEE